MEAIPAPSTALRAVSSTPEIDADPAQIAAFNLKYRTGAAYVSAEFQGLSESTVPMGTYDIYLRDLMVDAGQPSDPILRILIEQLAMSHHKIGRLNRQSVGAASIEEARVYDAAAVNLLAELRRLALAVKEYRAPTAAQHVTHVKQQNVAQNQQVALVEGQPQGALAVARPRQKVIPHNGELTSKGKLEHVPTEVAVTQSTSSSSREAQPVVAARPQRRGASAAPPVGAHAPTMAARHRPANRNG